MRALRYALSDFLFTEGLVGVLHGRIQAGGIDKDVTFVDANPALNDQIDAVYRSKYRRYTFSIINSIMSPVARSATIKLAPRIAHS